MLILLGLLEYRLESSELLPFPMGRTLSMLCPYGVTNELAAKGAILAPGG
jgi:hypothetical protein